jgi:hypothetical protein
LPEHGASVPGAVVAVNVGIGNREKGCQNQGP